MHSHQQAKCTSLKADQRTLAEILYVTDNILSIQIMKV